MKSKAVIFDFDGVIVDSVYVTYKLSKKALPFLTYPMFIYTYKSKVALRILQVMKRFFASPNDIKRHKAEYTKEKIEVSNVFDHMRDVLFALHANYLLALNTNAAAAETYPILEKHGIDKVFAEVLVRDEKRIPKSERNVTFMQSNNIESENAIFVTDTMTDVQLARESGLKAIGVTWGVHKRHDFEHSLVKDNVYAIVDDPLELKEAINSFFDEG